MRIRCAQTLSTRYYCYLYRVFFDRVSMCFKTRVFVFKSTDVVPDNKPFSDNNIQVYTSGRSRSERRTAVYFVKPPLITLNGRVPSAGC